MESDPQAAVACTLPPDELLERLAWIRRVSAHGLVSHQRDGASWRLSYKLSALPDLQRLVEQERLCCSQLSFSLTHGGDVASLMISAPKGQEDEAQWLFEQFVPPPAPCKACGCAPSACG
jgi:hypothetical protein